MLTTRRFQPLRALVVATLLGVLVVVPVARSEDLTEMSLADLLDVRVTSVARQDQDIYQAPAAVYVISAEDLRRSGVTSLPEALRLVPGVEVARIDANKWAVSIHAGFQFPLRQQTAGSGGWPLHIYYAHSGLGFSGIIRIAA